MNSLTQRYRINGVDMIAPDENMELSFEDIDAADAGRDESGVMHRIPVRRKVGKWGFHYTYLTEAEYSYLLALLPKAGEFTFTHPSLTNPGQSEDCTAYLSGLSLLWQGHTGGCRDVKFNIIEC